MGQSSSPDSLFLSLEPLVGDQLVTSMSADNADNTILHAHPTHNLITSTKMTTLPSKIQLSNSGSKAGDDHFDLEHRLPSDMPASVSSRSLTFVPRDRGVRYIDIYMDVASGSSDGSTTIRPASALSRLVESIAGRVEDLRMTNSEDISEDENNDDDRREDRLSEGAALAPRTGAVADHASMPALPIDEVDVEWCTVCRMGNPRDQMVLKAIKAVGVGLGQGSIWAWQCKERCGL